MTTWFGSIAPLTDIWVERLAHACWTGSMVIVLVWGICRLWPQMPPSVRCWIWRLAYVKLLLSLVTLTPISLPLLPAADSTPTMVIEATQSPSAPASSGGLPLQLSDILPESAPERLETRLSTQAFDWSIPLAGVWLAGVLLVGMRITHAWYESWRLRQSATMLDDAVLNATCHRVCDQLGIALPPRLMVTEAVVSPALLGLIHPVILLPKPLMSACAQRQFELILAHELAHLKRRDLLWQCLPTCAHLLLFFHPLVWLAQREYRLAQEMACDVQVVLHSRIPVAEYGHLLLAVAGGSNGFRGRAWCQSTARLLESATALKQRLKALAQVREPSRPRLILYMIALVVLGAVLLIPWRLTTQAMPSARPDTMTHDTEMQVPRDVVAVANSTLETAVRTMVAAYNAGDVAAFLQYLGPTVTSLEVGATLRRIDIHPSAMADAFRAGFKPQIAIDDVNIGGFSQNAFVTVKLSGTLTETTGVTYTGPWRLRQKWIRQDDGWRLAFYRGFPLLPWEMEVPKHLRQVLRQYWRATMTADADALTALFAPEAQVIFSALPHQVHGQKTIRQAYAQRFRDFPTNRIEHLTLDLHGGGDAFAVIYASYRIAETDSRGQTRHRDERVSLTYIRVNDQWLIVNQHYSPSRKG